MKLNFYWPNACFDELTYKDFCKLRNFNNAFHKTVQSHVKRIISLLTLAVILFLLIRESVIFRWSFWPKIILNSLLFLDLNRIMDIIFVVTCSNTNTLTTARLRQSFNSTQCLMETVSNCPHLIHR